MLFLSSVFVSYLLTLICVFYLLYRYITSNFDYWKKRNVPYQKPVPFLGSISKTLTFQQGMGELLGDLYKKFNGRYFGIFVFNEPILVLRDPEIIKRVLVKDFDIFNDRAAFHDEKIDPLSANFLFFAKYKKWKVLRTKLSPIFTSGKLKLMFPQMENIANNMNSYLQKKAAENDSIIFNARELCNRYSMDILASCAFGMNGECFEKENAPFYEIGKRIFGYSLVNDARMVGYTVNNLLIKLTHMTLLDKYVTKFILQGIGSQIEDREKNNGKRNDLIDILVDLKKLGNVQGIYFDENILAASAGQFFTAGYETVSTTMSFGLYEIALHPEVKEKLQNELRELLMEDGKLEYTTVQKLPYLDQVIKETLRKYPLLPYLDRKCKQKYEIPGSDLILEAGTKVYIPLFGLHYDEKYFPDPHRFDPDRFSEENKVKFPPSAYLPFGEGPRICIGERFALTSLKTGLAKLLTEYDVEPCAETPIPIVFNPKSLTLMPTRNLCLKFKKISSPY